MRQGGARPVTDMRPPMERPAQREVILSDVLAVRVKGGSERSGLVAVSYR